VSKKATPARKLEVDLVLEHPELSPGGELGDPHRTGAHVSNIARDNRDLLDARWHYSSVGRLFSVHLVPSSVRDAVVSECKCSGGGSGGSVGDSGGVASGSCRESLLMGKDEGCIYMPLFARRDRVNQQLVWRNAACGNH
jgi:hypothetical protein